MANNNFCRLFFSHDNISMKLSTYLYVETLVEASQIWARYRLICCAIKYSAIKHLLTKLLLCVFSADKVKRQVV